MGAVQLAWFAIGCHLEQTETYSKRLPAISAVPKQALAALGEECYRQGKVFPRAGLSRSETHNILLFVGVAPSTLSIGVALAVRGAEDPDSAD